MEGLGLDLPGVEKKSLGCWVCDNTDFDVLAPAPVPNAPSKSKSGFFDFFVLVGCGSRLEGTEGSVAMGSGGGGRSDWISSWCLAC